MFQRIYARQFLQAGPTTVDNEAIGKTPRDQPVPVATPRHAVSLQETFMTSVATFIAQQNAAATGRGNGGTALDYDATATTVPGGNAVIGLQTKTFTGGYNAVVLDGSASQYGFNVDATGLIHITDHTGGATNGQTVTVSGAAYLVFDGAAMNADGSYQQIGIVADASHAWVGELYQAAFGRQPDLTGLEYWQLGLASGQWTLHSEADFFLHSPEFTHRFGALDAMDNSAFAGTLYQNILGRAPDTSGLNYWVGQLDAGESRADVLLGFTSSNENANRVSLVNGGWLISTATGGYATSDALLPADTVVSQGLQTGTINTQLIDPSSISTLPQGLLPDGTVWVGKSGATTGVVVGMSNITVDLSSGVNVLNVTLNTTGITVYGAPTGGSVIGMSHGTIVLNGTGNEVFAGSILASNIAGDHADLAIANFGAGNTLTIAGATTRASTVQFLAPTSSSHVAASSLNFATTAYVVNLGDVGSGSVTEVAAKANALIDLRPTTAAVTSIENFVLIGQAGTDTVAYVWSESSYYSSHGTNPTTIDANSFLSGVMLLGVQANNLVASEFH